MGMWAASKPDVRLKICIVFGGGGWARMLTGPHSSAILILVLIFWIKLMLCWIQIWWVGRSVKSSSMFMEPGWDLLCALGHKALSFHKGMHIPNNIKQPTKARTVDTSQIHVAYVPNSDLTICMSQENLRFFRFHLSRFQGSRGERRLAHLVWSNRKAAVAQIVEYVNGGYDSKVSEYTVQTCCVSGCVAANHAHSWKHLLWASSTGAWKIGRRCPGYGDESHFLLHHVEGLSHVCCLPGEEMSWGCTMGRRQAVESVWCSRQCSAWKHWVLAFCVCYFDAYHLSKYCCRTSTTHDGNSI